MGFFNFLKHELNILKSERKQECKIVRDVTFKFTTEKYEMNGHCFKLQGNIEYNLHLSFDFKNNIYSFEEIEKEIQERIEYIVENFVKEEHINISCEVTFYTNEPHDQWLDTWANNRDFLWCTLFTPFEDPNDYCRISRYEITNDTKNITLHMHYHNKHYLFFEK